MQKRGMSFPAIFLSVIFAIIIISAYFLFSYNPYSNSFENPASNIKNALSKVFDFNEENSQIPKIEPVTIPYQIPKSDIPEGFNVSGDEIREDITPPIETSTNYY